MNSRQIKTFICTCILFGTMISLSGCWIALPSYGLPEFRKYIGNEYNLNKDILIVSYWLCPIAWRVESKPQLGSNQKIIKTIKAGKKIKLLTIKSILGPPGRFYMYRCVEVDTGIKFDLGFDMLDYIGISSKEP